MKKDKQSQKRYMVSGAPVVYLMLGIQSAKQSWGRTPVGNDDVLNRAQKLEGSTVSHEG